MALREDMQRTWERYIGQGEDVAMAAVCNRVILADLRARLAVLGEHVNTYSVTPILNIISADVDAWADSAGFSPGILATLLEQNYPTIFALWER